MIDADHLPITRQQATAARADAIRANVRNAESMPTENATSRLAIPEDATILFEFLRDPVVHAPIYSLPRPLTQASVQAFIERHLVERARGVGLLFLNFDTAGLLGGYTDVQVWPEWAAGELGGALHPDRQNRGQGGKGAWISFDWMYRALDLSLICETASPDNFRTARLLDSLGFDRKGEIVSQRNDGSKRRSLVWEMTRDAWLAKHSESL